MKGFVGEVDEMSGRLAYTTPEKSVFLDLIIQTRTKLCQVEKCQLLTRQIISAECL